MTRPSCVPSSALLPGRGLPLSGDPGDLHLGVALAVAHPSPVAGLVLVMNDVDLGAGYRAQDLRGDLVVAKLVGVADDLAIIDHEHGRKRHAGPDLTSEGVDGQDVVHRRLLLPATAAHDRVHRRTLSLLVRAHRVVPAPSGPRTRRGARQPCTGHPGNPALDPSCALGLQVIRPRRPPMPPAPSAPAPRPCPVDPAPGWRPDAGAVRRTAAPTRYPPARPRRRRAAPPRPGSPRPGSPRSGSPRSGSPRRCRQ